MFLQKLYKSFLKVFDFLRLRVRRKPISSLISLVFLFFYSFFLIYFLIVFHIFITIVCFEYSSTLSLSRQQKPGKKVGRYIWEQRPLRQVPPNIRVYLLIFYSKFYFTQQIHYNLTLIVHKLFKSAY